MIDLVIRCSNSPTAFARVPLAAPATPSPAADSTVPAASMTVTSSGFMSLTDEATRCTIASTSDPLMPPMDAPATNTEAVGVAGSSMNNDSSGNAR